MQPYGQKMGDPVEYVLSGFRKLTREQQDDLLKRIERERVIKEDIKKSSIVLGPLPAGCPCCGK